MNSYSPRELPSRSDWGDLAGDFDAQDAFKKFNGLSKQEAKRLFGDDVLACAQDIRFMPSIPFTYYLEAFCEFVLDGVYGDSLAWMVADSFASVLSSRIEGNASALISNKSQIEKAFGFIVSNQQRFAIDETFYADLSWQLEQILQSIDDAVQLGRGQD